MSMSDYEVGATFATADMKKAREFYEDKLGLKPDGDPPEDPVDPDQLPLRQGHRHQRLSLPRARRQVDRDDGRMGRR